MLPWLSWNRNFRLLAIAVFGSGIFFGVQFSLFHNFIVEGIGIEAHELGYMEALREVPGFLNALFIAVTILLSPPLLGGISLIVMGLGLALYAQADSFFGSPYLFVYLEHRVSRMAAVAGNNVNLLFGRGGERKNGLVD